MRIIQNTSNRLILRNGPYAQMILAASIVLSGLVVGLIASQLIPSISVDPAHSLELTCIAILAVVGGVLLALVSQVTTLTFDKTQAMMTLEKHSLLFNNIHRYPLKDISSADIEISADHESESYRINIVLASGQNLPLSHVYTGWREDKEKAIQAINQFLNS